MLIAKESWTDKDENELDSMSTTAAIVVSDAVKYPLLVTVAALLTNKANAYHIAQSLYNQFGGNTYKDAKDQAKGLLYKAHEEVAKKLEETAEGDANYMTAPGYKLAQTGGNRHTGVVPKPVISKAVSNETRGLVKFILKAADPLVIKGVVGISSADNGVTWQNGITAFGLRFEVDGQPSGANMLYKFMFIATNNRKSGWSDAEFVEVF